MRNILVATDGSEGGNRAMDVAAEIAKGVGGNLSIITVEEKLSRDELRQLSATEKDAWEAVDSFSKEVLRQGTKRAQSEEVSVAKTHIAFGDPAATIINIVHRESIDILVVGRRGRGQLVGLLLGSVSQKLVTLAPCIVVVVP